MGIRYPSRDNSDPKRRAVAQWIEQQRQSYRLGTLSNEKIEKLERLSGWVWESDHGDTNSNAHD